VSDIADHGAAARVEVAFPGFVEKKWALTPHDTGKPLVEFPVKDVALATPKNLWVIVHFFNSYSEVLL
jgi:hypothetical protein